MSFGKKGFELRIEDHWSVPALPPVEARPCRRTRWIEEARAMIEEAGAIVEARTRVWKDQRWKKLGLAQLENPTGKKEERAGGGKKKKCDSGPLLGPGLGFGPIMGPRLGFSPVLGPGLGRLWPESRIAESGRFCDSTIQCPIQARLHHPDSSSGIRIVDTPLNRRIVRFYDSNHDSNNHGGDECKCFEDINVQ
ncbi:hypothetical protein CDL15_Pgr024267 [Punica granatum]|uniref:Uncharacterized protein n=1 Tax=Punica granatum TaxID=22663 RepID=A0A218XY54_PUNGR|nr:hypothetical protein CDL15_Pgr024267 [Punica granatum]